ncbi:MAG TPA: threonine ammonia-lyase [Thermoanaerobaculia bacterium]|nr:threonine ammonia-lyase [Thermoanaerobaculia bacterium]
MIGLKEIQAARATIGEVIKNTPCLRSRTFSSELRSNAYFKYETLQLTGSFKVRGACNKIRSLSPEQLRKGVVTASAGNHAQGVAFSANQAGAPATIVMPVTTPLIKVDNTERLGGKVVLAGEVFDEAKAEAKRLEAEQGLTFVPPFDDELVIAGQGTIGLEILEQVPDLDAVIVPIGGGGLISGIATAIKESKPTVKVYGVQTKAAPCMAESFRAGHRVTCDTERSVADGIAVKSPGELTFDYVMRYVDDVETVTEDQIRSAIVKMLEVGKTVTEGAAAAALAAMIERRFPYVEGRNAVIILSGANIDVSLLARIIDRSLVESRRLVRFRTEVTDRPGALADLLRVIASCGGNVVRIQHDRVFKHAGFWEAEVEVTLETRNEDHIEEIHRTLRKRGYDIARLD